MSLVTLLAAKKGLAATNAADIASTWAHLRDGSRLPTGCSSK
jgi:hypothetical protein